MNKIPLLPELRVPPGSNVLLVPAGQTEPATDTDGGLPPLHRLVGFANYYVFVPVPELERQRGGASVQLNTLRGFRPDVRFTPEQVFSAQDAPAETTYAIIVGNDCVGFEDRGTSPSWITVFKDPNGMFYINGHHAYSAYGKPMSLPADCVLTPIGQIGKGRNPRRVVEAGQKAA